MFVFADSIAIMYIYAKIDLGMSDASNSARLHFQKEWFCKGSMPKYAMLVPCPHPNSKNPMFFLKPMNLHLEKRVDSGIYDAALKN